MTVPANPKIYHITHIRNLASIAADGFLWSDATVKQKTGIITIGMSEIKLRRLKENRLSSHLNLHVGECVPFYFCPRSIMLYMISKQNHPELHYKGGQESIVHLEADLLNVVRWADHNNKRWAFTLSNAGACYFEDRADIAKLNELDWDAINSTSWYRFRENKQAEFLVEDQFPWYLVDRIGIISNEYYNQVTKSLSGSVHHPKIVIKLDWYY